jgi:hypothetical protein
MTPRLLTERLVETVFLPLDQIAERCRRWGLVAELNDGQLTLRRPPKAGVPFAGGLAEGTDPINRAVVLGLVLVGEPWPMALATLINPCAGMIIDTCTVICLTKKGRLNVKCKAFYE